MVKSVYFICDKCGGHVWIDMQSMKFYEMSCIICSKRWYVPKNIYHKVVERALKRDKGTDQRNVLVIS